MLSIQEAQEQILRSFQPLEIISLRLDSALGEILARPVVSAIDFPLFDNSSVDGFAVCAADVSQASSSAPALLRVIADIPAGITPHKPVQSGQAARIMTGAPLPPGADTVVMVEDTDAHDLAIGSDVPQYAQIFKRAPLGANIRRRGEDFQQGQEILPAGHRLRPQDIGMLALLGIDQIPARRKPRIAIISSGDELLKVGQPLQPGKIYDSNSPMLAALAKSAGAEVVFESAAPDQLDAVRDVFLRAAETQPDAIISSAGVGGGAFDYIKGVVGEAGNLDFWKVNMRPGKPLAFGHYQNIPFFGLPGNPVSSYVSFLVFVKPALNTLLGAPAQPAQGIKATLEEAIKSDGRQSYLRAILRQEDGKYFATLTGHQGSGNLFSTIRANALLIVPAGVTDCPIGSQLDAWLVD